MPELPEVESVVRSLDSTIKGLGVQKVNVYWDRTIATSSAKQFKSTLTSSVFQSFGRKGKYILAYMSNGWVLVIHLRMSGRLVSHKILPPDCRHLRVEFQLADSSSLCFFDVRKFGRMYLVRDENEVVGELGPDLIVDSLPLEKWDGMLRSKAAAIKPLLLRQDFLAGLGNIYVDEVLWQTRIHPLRLANSLSQKKAKELYESIQWTLNRAIESNGTDFGDGVVDAGLYCPEVYGREGEPCLRCGRAIKKIVVGGRGTHFCASCQRARAQ